MNSEHLLSVIDGHFRPRVLVVGDIILDRYVVGEVKRISPEAPIPVLNVERAELRLGGAGNVAANLRAMEAEVSEGLLTEPQAIGIASRIMHDNAYDCFDLPGTRAAIAGA